MKAFKWVGCRLISPIPICTDEPNVNEQNANNWSYQHICGLPIERCGGTIWDGSTMLWGRYFVILAVHDCEDASVICSVYCHWNSNNRMLQDWMKWIDIVRSIIRFIRRMVRCKYSPWICRRPIIRRNILRCRASTFLRCSTDTGNDLKPYRITSVSAASKYFSRNARETWWFNRVFRCLCNIFQVIIFLYFISPSNVHKIDGGVIILISCMGYACVCGIHTSHPLGGCTDHSSGCCGVCTGIRYTSLADEYGSAKCFWHNWPEFRDQ